MQQPFLLLGLSNIRRFSMKKMNVGIMGAGKIAEKVSGTLIQLDYVNCYAIGSRTLEKAEVFAKNNHFQVAYGSYEELVSDPNIDLIYIATPHSEHLSNIKLCAEHHKNIICEKAFTLDAKQAEEAIESCRKNKVFICEAIWPRYAPMAKKVRELLDSHRLGDIVNVSANLGYYSWGMERIRKNSLGGGAILDLGVYCINFIDLVLGSDFIDLKATACIDEVEKTDKYDTVTFTYPNNITATMFCSLMGATDRRGVINGTEGFAVIGNVNNYDSIEIYNNKRELVERIDCEDYITGYEFEFKEAFDCINSNKLESALVSPSHTIKIMKTMDKIREKIGLVYSN